MSETDEFKVWFQCECIAGRLYSSDEDAAYAGWQAAQWRGIPEAARATSQQAVPEGWKLVPVEPTEEMMTAMSRGAGCEGYIEIGYRMMLAASPAVQVDTRIGEMVCGDVESTLDGYEVGDYELIYGKELDEINVNHPGKVFAIYIDRAAMSVSKEAS